MVQFPPQKKRKLPLTNKSKYYKFHKDYGHDTNKCVTLEDEIESLIKRGRLTKYKHHDNQPVGGEKEKEREHSYSPR